MIQGIGCIGDFPLLCLIAQEGEHIVFGDSSQLLSFQFISYPLIPNVSQFSVKTPQHMGFLPAVDLHLYGRFIRISHEAPLGLSSGPSPLGLSYGGRWFGRKMGISMGSQWDLNGSFMGHLWGYRFFPFMGLSIFPMGSTTHFLHLCVLFTHSLVALKKRSAPVEHCWVSGERWINFDGCSWLSKA